MKNKSKQKWIEEIKSSKNRSYDFKTISGDSVDVLYEPQNIDNNFLDMVNYPGQFPYTRGIQANMYRGRLWTMRQFSGFGSPQDTNKRYKYLLKQGQTGLSVAFDMPT